MSYPCKDQSLKPEISLESCRSIISIFVRCKESIPNPCNRSNRLVNQRVDIGARAERETLKSGRERTSVIEPQSRHHPLRYLKGGDVAVATSIQVTGKNEPTWSLN